MATELVTFKLDGKFLNEVDKVAKKNGYSNRTDFIRDALRKKMNEIRYRDIYERLGKLRGAGKKKKQTTDEEIHKTREEVLQEMIKEKGWKLD